MAKWVKVQGTKWWNPSKAGEVLEGRFTGLVTVPGEHGTFRAVRVCTSDGQVWMVSGTRAVQLVEDSGLKLSEAVRLEFTGRQAGARFEYKEFDLYIEERRPETTVAVTRDENGSFRVAGTEVDRGE